MLLFDQLLPRHRTVQYLGPCLLPAAPMLLNGHGSPLLSLRARKSDESKPSPGEKRGSAEMKFAPKTAPIAFPKGSGERGSKSGSGESGSRKRRVPKMSRGSEEKIKKAKAGRKKRGRKGKDESPGKGSADDLGKKSGESPSKTSGEAISASKSGETVPKSGEKGSGESASKASGETLPKSGEKTSAESASKASAESASKASAESASKGSGENVPKSGEAVSKSGETIPKKGRKKGRKGSIDTTATRTSEDQQEGPRRRGRKRQRGMYRSGSESVDVSEHSDEDAEPESDSIEVLIPDELNEYVEKITVGKLSRYGFARSLRLRKMVLYLVALSYMGSLTSFTMFNYSIHRQGFDFIIPFFCCVYCISFPMVYLELALGQYTHASVLTIFDLIAPISVGIGVSAIILIALSVIINNDLLALSLRVFFNSLDMFGTGTTWNNCVGEHSAEYCRSLRQECGWGATKISILFQSRIGDTCVMPRSKAMGIYYGSFQPNIFDSMPLIHFGLSERWGSESSHWPPLAILGYIPLGFAVIAFLITFHPDSLSIVAHIYVCVMFLFISCTLMVLLFVNQPRFPSTKAITDLSGIADPGIWIESVLYACLIPQLGYGGVIFIGSQNPFFNDVVTDAMVISFLSAVMFVLQGYVFTIMKDSFILEVAHGDHVQFENFYRLLSDFSVKGNRDSTRHLSLYIGALDIFASLQPALAVLLSIFAALATMTTKMIRIEVIYTAVVDYFGLLPTKEIRAGVLCLICLGATLLSMLFECEDCHLIEVGLETNVLTMAGVIVIALELLVVCVCYGSRRLFSNVLTMTSGKTATQTASNFDFYLQTITNILLTVVIPVAVCTVVVTFLNSETTNFSLVEALLFTLILAPIPLCAIYRVWYYTTHKMDWRRLFTPDIELWGPRSSAHRVLAEKNEKRFRL